MYKNNNNESFEFEALGVWCKSPFLWMNITSIQFSVLAVSDVCIPTIDSLSLYLCWWKIRLSSQHVQPELINKQVILLCTYLYYKLIIRVFKFVKNRGKKLLTKLTILNRSKIDLLGVIQIFMWIFHDNIDQIMMFGG